jgi:transposase
MVWSIEKEMNTVTMQKFCHKLSKRYKNDLNILVMDGASSHKAKALCLPENIISVLLPAYSPELNPQEHVWDEMREKLFPNKICDSMEEVVSILKKGTPKLFSNVERLRSLTLWPWIRELLKKIPGMGNISSEAARLLN